MAFTIGSGTFTNGSATVTGVTLTSGTLAYFASGTRMVVGVNPVIQEVEAIAAPTVTTITLRSAWTGTGGTYSFLANQTSEGLRDAVQAIRSNNASLQSFIDSIDTAATADSVAQRTSDGSINAVNVYASGNVGVGTSSPAQKIHVKGSGSYDGQVFADNSSTTGGGVFSVGVNGTSVGFFSTSGSVVGDTSTDLAMFAADGHGLRFYSNGAERMRIDSSGNVGIGTTTTLGSLDVARSGSHSVVVRTTSTGDPSINLQADGQNNGLITYSRSGEALTFSNGGSEGMRIDTSGNVLVGKTAIGVATDGFEARASGLVGMSDTSAAVLNVNRNGTDGDIVVFYRNGTTVGSIGIDNSGLYIDGEAGHTGIQFAGDNWLPRDNGARSDDVVDLGTSALRFDDVYATNGTIQTSDRNEKQDIEELSEAEHRVAVACKGLLRKFRWISSVEEKGDDARIHFGIIAQDLQAAFEAEGLDAGRYAMFIYSEWWEHEVEVPAVEAQDAVYETVVTPAEYDEEGNEVSPETTEQRLVSEAVEGKEAYTRTDTYYSEAEAPEGSVKKSRMGVRYSELLAFIIAGL